MKKVISLLLTLALLLSLGVPALAEGGEADVPFGGKTYHYTYVGAEIVDGKLAVTVWHEGSIPMSGFTPQNPAIAIAEIAGKRVSPGSVRVTMNDGRVDYVFSYNTDALPDAVWLYPDGKESGAALLWDQQAAESASAPGPAAASGSAETEIPAELFGFWKGEGMPKNGSLPIALEVEIRADGACEYRFSQGDYQELESNPLTILRDGNRFTVDTSESQLGACEGTWALEDGVLKLDISSHLSDGRIFSYTATLTRQDPAEPAAGGEADTPSNQDAAEKAILFRGIPWGSSYTEIEKDVKLDHYWTFTLIERVAKAMGFEKLTAQDKDLMPLDVGLVAQAEYSRPLPEVAGYKTEAVILQFVYVPDENGALVEDKEHTALYHAYYTIEPADRAGAYEDLTNKLSSLYGGIDLSSGDFHEDENCVRVWFGGEGTIVSLEYSISSRRIYIHYGFAGGDDLLENAQEAINRSRAGDIGGL